MTEGRHIWVRWTTFKKTLAELGTFKSMAMTQQGFEKMSPNQRCPMNHECRTCGKTFTTARGLSIHVSKVHKVYDMFGGVPSHAESKLDHEAVPAKYFDDDECGPLADIIVSCLERDSPRHLLSQRRLKHLVIAMSPRPMTMNLIENT